MPHAPQRRLKFPCDCISSTPACEEPWALVAKRGMFKDGTREEILNRLNEQPRTIAQLAKAAHVTPPTVFRHMSDLVECGLVKEFDPDAKDYAVERYYTPNFPVITRGDQKKFREATSNIADELTALLSQRLAELKQKYARTDASEQGWSFEEFGQYLYHAIQRQTRQRLEDAGTLARQLKNADLDFMFWGTE